MSKDKIRKRIEIVTEERNKLLDKLENDKEHWSPIKDFHHERELYSELQSLHRQLALELFLDPD